jgi:hypothetical protein
MKKIILPILLLTVSILSASAYDDHYVQPHYSQNGGYIGGHWQTNPNGTTSDNYGTPGVFNPHTGRYFGE